MLFDQLKNVIKTIDYLRDVGLDDYIKLPRIVVIGQQSAGKSSLLQQIVGIDFLPRGNNVVTRRPLELRIIYQSPNNFTQQYAKFQQIQNKKFTDFSEVKKCIQELTDKLCPNKTIVDKPIILTVYSKNCPNLTLVDLPGITRVPLQGQPKNIYQIVYNMIKKLTNFIRYTEDQQAIILCAVPANQDLSTSQAIQIVREVDRSQQRTLVCLTKIDIMDKGTNARDILLNKEIKFKLGYVGIKCRSQEDIIQNKSVLEALQAQTYFFLKSPIYRTKSLTHKLSSLLCKKIEKGLPALISTVKKRKRELEQQLLKFGPKKPRTTVEKIGTIWNLVNAFTSKFKNSIEGKLAQKSFNIASKLQEVMANAFKQQTPQLILQQQITTQKLLLATQIYFQTLPNFINIDSFNSVVIPLIKKMETPSYEIVEQVYQILDNEGRKIIVDLMQNNSRIRDDLLDFFIDILKQWKEQTNNVVRNLFLSQYNYIFTNNLQMLDCKVYEKQEKEQKVPMTVKLLKLKVQLYFKTVWKNLRDIVPKQIYFQLIYKFQKDIKSRICKFISNQQKIDWWFEMNQQERKSRDKIENQLNTFNKSEQFLRKNIGRTSISQQFESKASIKQTQFVIKNYQFKKMTSSFNGKSEKVKRNYPKPQIISYRKKETQSTENSQILPDNNSNSTASNYQRKKDQIDLLFNQNLNFLNKQQINKTPSLHKQINKPSSNYQQLNKPSSNYQQINKPPISQKTLQPTNSQLNNAKLDSLFGSFGPETTYKVVDKAMQNQKVKYGIKQGIAKGTQQGFKRKLGEEFGGLGNFIGKKAGQTLTNEKNYQGVKAGVANQINNKGMDILKKK